MRYRLVLKTVDGRELSSPIVQPDSLIPNEEVDIRKIQKSIIKTGSYIVKTNPNINSYECRLEI